MDKKEALKELAEIDRVEAEQAARRAALRAIIEAPEKPGRWEPENGETYYVAYSDGGVFTQNWNHHSGLHRYCFATGNVHRTREEAETYKLWLESFVPVYGLTVPDIETLQKGWIVDRVYQRTTKGSAPDFLAVCYLDGTWHPTREAAEAWLERFGKVRGFTK